MTVQRRFNGALPIRSSAGWHASGVVGRWEGVCRDVTTRCYPRYTAPTRQSVEKRPRGRINQAHVSGNGVGGAMGALASSRKDERCAARAMRKETPHKASPDARLAPSCGQPWCACDGARTGTPASRHGALRRARGVVRFPCAARRWRTACGSPRSSA